MKNLIYFIVLALFASCEPITTESSDDNTEHFSKLTFDSQFNFLLENPSILENSVILDGLYDSISQYGHHEIFLTQTLGSFGIDYHIDILDVSMADPASVKRRNIFDFSIYNDTITARQEVINDTDILLDSMTVFVGNNDINGFYYPEYKMVEIPLLGRKQVSKQLYITYINLLDSIKNKKEWYNLIKVINYIKEPYDLIRERSSKEIWQINFHELDLIHKKSILELHPFRMILRFDRIWKKPPPPPPPPPAPENIDNY